MFIDVCVLSESYTGQILQTSCWHAHCQSQRNPKWSNWVTDRLDSLIALTPKLDMSGLYLDGGNVRWGVSAFKRPIIILLVRVELYRFIQYILYLFWAAATHSTVLTSHPLSVDLSFWFLRSRQFSSVPGSIGERGEKRTTDCMVNLFIAVA